MFFRVPRKCTIVNLSSVTLPIYSTLLSYKNNNVTKNDIFAFPKKFYRRNEISNTLSLRASFTTSISFQRNTWTNNVAMVRF